MYLTGQQKIKCLVGGIFFLLFFGFFRVIFTNDILDTKDIVLNTILFFIWLGYSYAISNMFIQKSTDDENLINF